MLVELGAMLALVKTVPATTAGAVAMLRFALEVVAEEHGDMAALGETRVPIDDERELITKHAETMLETLVTFLEAQPVQS